ncbi:MAG: glycosyltransferase [Deltaproteobacteria bacterium]|nr:glycosyltransferase [Deltaproteobacteria bacterium]
MMRTTKEIGNAGNPRVLATLPTYNEADNIDALIDALRAQEVEVLVADDDSPDGTWRLVEKRAAADPGVHLLHRTQKKDGVTPARKPLPAPRTRSRPGRRNGR